MSSEDDDDENCHESEDLEESMNSSSSNRGTSFDIASAVLFGNIDDNGQLDADDIFDEECKRHLHSLQPHLASILPYEDLLAKPENDDDEKEINGNDDEKNSFDKKNETKAKSSTDDNDDFQIKNTDAVDYSDIDEIIEDAEFLELNHEEILANSMLNSSNNDNDDDDDYDKPQSDCSDLAKNASQQQNELMKDKDGFLIPQTPTLRKETAKEQQDSKQTDDQTEKIDQQEEDKSKDGSRKRLDTPLAAMLPSKYADFDVTELFPEFRHNKVLRFSRLFGSGKSSSLPQIWKHVKNKRKNRHVFENKLFIIKTKDETSEDKEWCLKVADPNSIDPDWIELDDEIKLLENDFSNGENDRNRWSMDDEENGTVADWRYGPARIWYDRLKVPENGENFDYGFKLKSENEIEEEEENKKKPKSVPSYSDDAFHLVTQFQWENDVIWNADDIRQKVLAKLNNKNLASGWLPSGHNRTATAFNQQIRTTSSSSSTVVSSKPPSSSIKKSGDKKSVSIAANNIETSMNDKQDKICFSIFPIENEELIYGLWEKDVIWDVEAVDRIPSPKILTLDRNDENIILEIPVDEDPADHHHIPTTTTKHSGSAKEKKDGSSATTIRKSRLLLGKAGVIAEPEIMLPPSPPSNQKDPFNISNDEYYMQKTTTDAQLKSNVGSNLIQHSIPALELRQPFFPTFLNYQRLRSFHRPTLKKYSRGAIADTLPHGVSPLIKHIKRKAKQREQERLASGGGEMFFMRTPEDLTGKDGDLILTEYSEEHPPLLPQIGMASKIKNYYKRKPGKDSGAPNYKYGETVYCHTSPFLGNLQPGQSLQTLENNLFRAPMYEHQVPDTDFLVIRTRDNYFIREVETIFCVGQELPAYEVPGPNSKKANNFIRDFLQVFIYRLFWKSTDNPRRIKMEDIKKAFPSHSESSIRKRLKQCADFKRTGMDSNWWVLKSDFRLPSEDEIRAVVSPEACCAYYSMLAAEQRLKDAGYGEKSMFAQEDAEDEDLQVKMDDEVRAAPWNTTRAFISATKGKCLLQLTGVADPTGNGEGFSYVRVPNKPQQSKEEAQKEPLPKKTVTGTDADLRRLPLKDAKQLLRKFGVPDEEMKKLSRWEVIDVVRTLSTKQAKQANEEQGEDDAMSKFARGNRFSIAEHQERYKEECQRIFDLQNRVLASTEDLSTDEDESEDEEDSEIEELGKNIESMLANKKTIKQISRDKEEEERRELMKKMFGEDSNHGDSKSKNQRTNKEGEENDADRLNSLAGGRILKIYRTFTSSDGKEFTRIETVRKPAVIDTYARIRNTKDEQFIRQFASALDDQQKEEKRKEKRRLQEQMRRMKRNQEKEKMATSFRNQLLPTASILPLSSSSPNLLPNFSSNNLSLNNFMPSMSKLVSGGSNSVGGLSSFQQTIEPSPLSKAELISSKAFKKPRKEKDQSKSVNLKCGACGSVGHMRTNRACPLYNFENGSAGELSFMGDDTSNSQHSQQNMLTPNQLQQQSTSQPPLPLNEEHLVKIDETKLVLSKTVMKQLVAEAEQQDQLELQQQQQLLLQQQQQQQLLLQQKEQQKTMKSLKLKIPREVLTTMKRKRRATTQDQNDYLQKPDYQKSANRRRTDPLVILSDIFEDVVNEMRLLSDTEPFHQPVSQKTIPDYYRIIGKPMDLQTIRQKIRDKRYKNREEFLNDVSLILKNSETYNGINHFYTMNAKKMFEVCVYKLQQKDEEIIKLEKIINPLLDDEQVAFSYILKTIVIEKLRTITESWPFHKPVNQKKVKNYHEIIKSPMDLETLESKASNHLYKSREQFLSDVELIYENSAQFNGIDSPFTLKAAEIVSTARSEVEQYESQLIELEKSIAATTGLALLEGGEMYDDEEDESRSSNLVGSYEDEQSGGGGGGDPQPKRLRFGNGDDDDDDENFIEDDMDIKDDGQQSLRTGDIVADDLHITPQNSDEDESDNENLKMSWNVSSGESMMMMIGGNSEQPQQQQQPQQSFTRSNDDNDDFDENYDPSEFLLQTSFAQQSNFFKLNQQQQTNNQATEELVDVSQDLDVSDSEDDDDDDDDDNMVGQSNVATINNQNADNDDEDENELWF